MEGSLMDDKELGKKVKWLEKQRQKDAETITRLKERLEGNITTIESLQRQVKELAGETARIAAMSSKVSEVESALAKHRQAISRMIDESSKTSEGSVDGKDSYGRSDIEKLSITTVELREGLRDLSDIRNQIDQQREEQVQISRGLNTIEKRFEGQVVFDERRKGEKRRIFGRSSKPRRLLNSSAREKHGLRVLMNSNQRLKSFKTGPWHMMKPIEIFGSCKEN